MNIIFTCRSKKCRASFLVPALDPQLPLLAKSGLRCPNAECKNRLRETGRTNLTIGYGVQKVSALQLYQACMGVGSPEERKCSPADVHKIMIGAVVTDVDLETSPDFNRTLIHSIEFNNGKILHLATSTKGATIFKITEGTRGR